jgi:hypothetical protein
MVDNPTTNSSYRLNEWAQEGVDLGQTSIPDIDFMYLFIARNDLVSQLADQR